MFFFSKECKTSEILKSEILVTVGTDYYRLVPGVFDLYLIEWSFRASFPDRLFFQ